MNFNKKVVRTTKVDCTLSGAEIVQLLRLQHPDLRSGGTIEVFVNVPGGGDWSNQRLDITDSFPLNVTITWTVPEEPSTPGDVRERSQKRSV